MESETWIWFAAAILWDALWGEVPRHFHPVVWMGACGRRLMRWAPQQGASAQRTWGICVALALPVGFALGAAGVLQITAGAAIVQGFIAVWLLKSTFAWRALHQAIGRLAVALEQGQLLQAQNALRALCSRNAKGLSRETLASAGISSAAENTCDSLVAPLCFFVLAGIPGAVFYRAVNTLDALFGYPHAPWTHLGWASARLDDVCNWIPARLSAFLLLFAGVLLGRDARAGWHTMRTQHGRSPSPNSGWTMAATAGLLGVRLEKADAYCLGQAVRPLDFHRLEEARQLTLLVWACCCALSLGGLFLWKLLQ